MIEIIAGVFYDNDLRLWQQSEEVQALVNAAVETEPVAFENEDCDSGNVRPVWRDFILGDVRLKVTYRYNAEPESREWGGLRNKRYLVYGE